MLNKESKIILWITGASHFSVHASMLIFPAIMITLQDYLNVGLDTLGWMYMLSSFMFGLGSIPAGFLEKKFGGRNLLVVFQIGASISGLIIIFANDLTIMTFGMMLLGLSASIYHPAGLTIISRRVLQTSKAMGYHGIAGSLGLSAGPLLAAWFASIIDWRFAYFTMIVFWVILSVVTVFLIPAEHISVDVKEKITGNLEIREVFSISKVGNIAGCFVKEGIITRNSKIRLLRDNVVVHTGTITSLKRFKEEVKEVKNNLECGVMIENYSDIKINDIIETFEIIETARKL